MNKAEETMSIDEAITRIECAIIGCKCADEIALKQVRRILEQYAQQSREDFANYIEEHYQEGDGDTISIHDWLFNFNHQNKEEMKAGDTILI
jgi:hypothetical protein